MEEREGEGSVTEVWPV